MRKFIVTKGNVSKSFDHLHKALSFLSALGSGEIFINIIENYYSISAKVFEKIDDKLITLNEEMLK